MGLLLGFFCVCFFCFFEKKHLQEILCQSTMISLYLLVEQMMIVQIPSLIDLNYILSTLPYHERKIFKT